MLRRRARAKTNFGPAQVMSSMRLHLLGAYSEMQAYLQLGRRHDDS